MAKYHKLPNRKMSAAFENNKWNKSKLLQEKVGEDGD